MQKPESPARVAESAAPVAPRGVRRACLCALLLFAAYLAVLGGMAIGRRAPDFEYFYRAGAYLLEYGQLDQGMERTPSGALQPRGTIDWYLPFVSRLMTLIAWLPWPAAGGLWLAVNLTAFFAVLVLLGRHVMGLPPQDWPVTLLLPVLLLGLFWHWEFRLNQIDVLTLLLVVASFVHWQQGRGALGGFWLGLAALVKLTPLLLVVWYALKRQFRTAAIALLTVAVAGPVADVVVFGPAYAGDAYRRWLRAALADGSHRGLVLRQKEMDWRNQGLGAVASRWLHPTNYALHFDNDPRIRTHKRPAMMNVVDLPLTTIAGLVSGAVGAALAGLLWLTRRPARALSTWQLRAEWALVVLAMLWLMPVLRRYHLIMLLPALAVLASGVHYAGRRRAWSKLALGGIGGVVACQLAVATRALPETGLVRRLAPLLGPQTAARISQALDAGIVEASGLLLLTVVLLAIPLIALLHKLGRDPDALPRHAWGCQRVGRYCPPPVAGPLLTSPAGRPAASERGGAIPERRQVTKLFDDRAMPEL